MTIPLSTVEKLLDSHRDKREMVKTIGPITFTLSTTEIPNESCILVLSKVIPNPYKFRTTE